MLTIVLASMKIGNIESRSVQNVQNSAKMVQEGAYGNLSMCFFDCFCTLLASSWHQETADAARRA